MTTTLAPTTIRLRPDVTLTEVDGAVEVSHPWGRQRIRGLRSNPSPSDFAQRLPHLVSTRVGDLATFVPTSRFAPSLHGWAQEGAALSRFAYLHRLDGRLVLESPLAEYRVEIHDPAVAALLAALPDTLGFDDPAVHQLYALLHHAGFLAADNDSTLWDFHDLLFHTRSRSGRHDYVSGGVFAHPDVAQRPALVSAAATEGPAIDLPIPDWQATLDSDPRLTEVLEARRSVRAYLAEPITVSQLGELLYRAARVRRVIPAAAGDPHGYDVVDRPYPAGGATGDLEIFVSVVECTGLEPGAYRYDSAAHQLRRCAGDEGAYRELVTGAWRATNQTGVPQVLLTVVSRIERLSWKYSNIAYALTLKHVGALYQTLYLVATAMGLGPCALGSGDVSAAARAFGVDWLRDAAVGEFMLGNCGPVADSTGFADVVGQQR